MKNDQYCGNCTYINVPTAFGPCLGCKGNVDHLAQDKKPDQAAGYQEGGNIDAETGTAI